MVYLWSMSELQRYIQFPQAHSNKQAVVMQALVQPNLQEIWVACGTKFGKAQDIDTPIPTPKGWQTLGDICPGDFVFDENGKPIKVLEVSPIYKNRKCYEVVFSDDSKIVSDGEHLWTTSTHSSRRNLARNPSILWQPKTRTTLEIKETVNAYCGSKVRPNHGIPCVSGPLQFEEKHLPIDPYVLGVWLGDGSTSGGQITSSDKEMKEELNRAGYYCNFSEYNPLTLNTRGLFKDLKELGVINNKHVPSDYLIASPEQRLALLQGLMDTDGTISKRGDCCFDNTNLNLANAVADLAISFGIKINRSDRFGKINGIPFKLCYRVWFTTDVPVFKLPRQFARMRKVSSKAKMRYIVAVEAVKSVPVKCITVDNSSHLFLIGKSCIPTHNSLSASVCIASALMNKPGTYLRWVAPIYEQSQIGFSYVKKLLPADAIKANEREPSIKVLGGHEGRIRFFHGQDPMSLEGEAVDGYVLDEAAKMKKQVYISANTTMTQRGIKSLILSTPLGCNWFKDGCDEAKEEMQLAKRQGRMPRKLFVAGRTQDNPFVPRESIEFARKTFGERLFRQYYLAEFLSDGAVFQNLLDCYYTERLDLNEEFRYSTDDCKECEVVIGVDWARQVDFTVFTAIDVSRRKVIAMWRMNKIPYNTQIISLKRFASMFKEVFIILHDKTGVGVALDDMLSETDLPFKGITFTNTNKNEMVTNLCLSTEAKDIGLPNISFLDDEMKTFEIKHTSLGLPTYSAPSGGHDDIVMSIMLAHAAMNYASNRDYSIMSI